MVFSHRAWGGGGGGGGLAWPALTASLFPDSVKEKIPWRARRIHFESNTNLIPKFCFHLDSAVRMTQCLSNLFSHSDARSHQGILNLNRSHLSCGLSLGGRT